MFGEVLSQIAKGRLRARRDEIAYGYFSEVIDSYYAHKNISPVQFKF